MDRLHPEAHPDRDNAILPRVAGRLARRHGGKPVRRRTLPPTGVQGRLRLLRDECPRTRGPFPDLRRLTLSFETDEAIYEPFSIPACDPAQIEAIRRASVTGAPTTLR